MYDEYLAVPGVLSEIIKGDREEHADAFIIACFGDPGLLAAKEVTEKPVIGIAQAAFTVAKMIAPNFSCRIRIGSFRTGSSGGHFTCTAWSNSANPAAALVLAS